MRSATVTRLGQKENHPLFSTSYDENTAISQLAISVILFSGCASARFTQTGAHFPAYDGIVRVFFEAPQDSEYEEIGIVSSKGVSIHGQADMIKAIQKKAAKHGAT